jgi:hypothetical protein
MAVDIYLRLPNDPNYNPYYLEVEDEISNFIQRVEMILTTIPGEVLGEPDFGINLEGYLWNQYITVGSIKNAIMTQIRRYCVNSLAIPFTIDVNFVRGDITDSIIIDIIIDGQKAIGVVASPDAKSTKNLNV